MTVFEILDCTPPNVQKCAGIVRAGGIIVFPTDTTYGIGCDPYSDAAVERIFSIKSRDRGKPLPVLTYSVKDAERLVWFNESARTLADRFWPGALTIVAELADRSISAKVTGGRNNLAVRVPANDCVLSLLKECRYLVGTSANISGRKPPASSRDIIGSGMSGFDALLVDDRISGTQSTVVDVTGPKVEIVRAGAIKPEEIFSVLGT
jgi:L-threonylcarbamoyladenylate synthase